MTIFGPRALKPSEPVLGPLSSVWRNVMVSVIRELSSFERRGLVKGIFPGYTTDFYCPEPCEHAFMTKKSQKTAMSACLSLSCRRPPDAALSRL